MPDISIIFCGSAGQGIQTIEYGLTRILKKAGYYNFATKEYMSRIHGGSNSSEIRISDHAVSAFVNRIDILVLLSAETFSHVANRISPDTLIIGACHTLSLPNKKYAIDFEKSALDLGSKRYASAVVVGFVLAFLKIETSFYDQFFAQYYGGKSKELAEKNTMAAQAGYQAGVACLTTNAIPFNAKSSADLDNKILLNGSEALAFGAIAGGCNFIASYPMSPSTGVLTQLASLSHEFDIVVEQAEDEIAAINMGLGAWYAGGRALVTTSGGGFALMCEGLSLSGMTETPIVISLGQRPGPATGLPTRTEQGDLNLALFAGHGEFPRVILAPGTIEQAFYLMQKAFYLADQYQIPVIVLSDQFFVDSYFVSQKVDPLSMAIHGQHIVKTEATYQRYQLTADGISPRGIPGFGEGLVCVDSDEHTEAGYITESFDIRTKMVQKRLKKLELLQKEIITPDFFGPEDYKMLLVCWGSNYFVIKEALELLQYADIGCLHFSQVYPLSQTVVSYFTRAQKTMVIENNATGQLAQLLKQQLNVSVNATLLKYNGMPFSVEEIVAAIKKYRGENENV
ncbi:MAG: 2-oxoacid:ferredoxin oxidoreductase subunit alpha [Gammaproteobacteria bacterium GWE2_42_36]|nr:MAG: 2-oxoacid:ferredoxin oxidoreductase subunit alpha [Gammaproteobacteria bacterium GWE2_42_36]